MATVEKIDKIENIHDDIASSKASSDQRDTEVASDYCK